ncbi:hypothetical protein [Nocardiopsis sp. EMB25]|nr:hypothetical protein [Nocardiopsis sp. EMB25]
MAFVMTLVWMLPGAIVLALVVTVLLALTGGRHLMTGADRRK